MQCLIKEKGGRGIFHQALVLPGSLGQAEAQVRQILSRMPINKKSDTRINHQRIKDILDPLMVIDVPCVSLREFDQTVD